MSADELSHLLHNFNALQGKFVRLVTEKADLLEKLQENEHLIVELSYETETIGMTPFHTIPHRMTPFHTGRSPNHSVAYREPVCCVIVNLNMGMRYLQSPRGA